MKHHPAPPSAATAVERTVVPIGVEPPVVTPPPVKRPSRLHAFGISGMALSALFGICSMLALITVTWPDELRRYVVISLVGSIVAFLVCSSLAISSAAGDTYARAVTETDGEAEEDV